MEMSFVRVYSFSLPTHIPMSATLRLFSRFLYFTTNNEANTYAMHACSTFRLFCIDFVFTVVAFTSSHFSHLGKWTDDAVCNCCCSCCSLKSDAPDTEKKVCNAKHRIHAHREHNNNNTTRNDRFCIASIIAGRVACEGGTTKAERGLNPFVLRRDANAVTC